MTADWLIALSAEESDAVIVVEDQGEEWCGLRDREPRRALRYSEALTWLQAAPLA